MIAGANNILRLIDGTDKKFIIPVYQRPYSWKKKNCEQLLSDLKEVSEKEYPSHFFGSLVYVSENVGGCEEYLVIDGQQRIITVSLLLLAVRNYILEHPELSLNSINTDKIKNAYLTDAYANDTKKLKLKLIQGDDAAYEALIEGRKLIENTNITANYNYFHDEIGKMSPEMLEGVYQAIGKLDIVSISLQPQNGDDPQLIFESLNSTGLALETADKIRNYVLINMKHQEQETFYRNYWEPLEQTVGHEDLDKFIRYYLAVKTRELYSENRLYFEFKDYRRDSHLPIELIFKDMNEYAGYYNAIVNPEKEKTEYSEILERINKLTVKTYIPLAMDLFKAKSDGRISSVNMGKALEVIENYIVRREVCNLPANVFNKLFVQIGAEIDKEVNESKADYYEVFCYKLLSRKGKSRFPNNHEFSECFVSYDLYDAKPGMKKYILERLENFGNKEQVAVEKQLDEKDLTIEHIMPQTLNEEWKQQLGKDWELIQTKYLNTPGNLTLTAYNSDYSNNSFQKKKEMPDKGFRFSKLSLNDYMKTCDTWGAEQILERAGILYQKAEKIWWIPVAGKVEQTESAEWISWDEDIDLTNKKVLQVEVLGKTIKTKHMSDAYRKIHHDLFELDPTVYYNSDFSWFGETGKNMRKPYQISENAYIEVNLSTQNKFNTIKKTAEAMKLDSNDIRLLIEDKHNKDELKIDDDDEIVSGTLFAGESAVEMSANDSYETLSVGKLAYKFFKELMEKKLISKEEIQQFKTKEYTAKLFKQTRYPALSDSRLAYKGNGKKIRYRKEPLILDGKEIYVTIEFFNEDRDALIQWYKSHCK